MLDKDFEKKVNETVAKNLTYYLELREMTQADLAKLMNVSTATTSNWCKGIKLPRMDKVDRICHYLDISRSDLIEEHNNNKPTAPPTPELSPSEEFLVDVYRDLNEEGKDRLVDYADDLHSMGKYKKDYNTLSASA